MAGKYVLDACALIAFINDEPGADIVENALNDANNGHADIYMNKLNLFEVFYGIRQVDGLQRADEFYNVVQRLPITIINGISDDVFREASRIKIQYRMSLADSIALGEASVMDAALLTSDHHEFDAVEKNTGICFAWIR